MKKLNRTQLRRLIEDVSGSFDEQIEYTREMAQREIDRRLRQKGETELETQTNIGLDIFNQLFKDSGYFPKCTAMPSLNTDQYQIEIKCPPGSENKIISFLKKNENDLTNDLSRRYDTIEHTYEVIRPGRIGVHFTTYD